MTFTDFSAEVFPKIFQGADFLQGFRGLSPLRQQTPDRELGEQLRAVSRERNRTEKPEFGGGIWLRQALVFKMNFSYRKAAGPGILRRKTEAGGEGWEEQSGSRTDRRAATSGSRGKRGGGGEGATWGQQWGRGGYSPSSRHELAMGRGERGERNKTEGVLYVCAQLDTLTPTYTRTVHHLRAAARSAHTHTAAHVEGRGTCTFKEDNAYPFDLRRPV